MVTNNLRFPGQYFDDETGLYQNYFRDYNPSLGRYIETDPIGMAGGINNYGYVLQNPISSFDSNGKSGLAIGVGVGVLVGGVYLYWAFIKFRDCLIACEKKYDPAKDPLYEADPDLATNNIKARCIEICGSIMGMAATPLTPATPGIIHGIGGGLINGTGGGG